MQPKRLSILGVGLLGGSVGLAAKSAVSDCEIVGYGHRPETLDLAVQIGAIDRGRLTASQAVEGADLVLLCTPVGLFPSLLEEIGPVLKPGAIVTDVGSTKRTVVASAERILPRAVRFVGSHPMAGSEKRGVEFARTDLFHNALCLLTPTPATDAAALDAVEAFWRVLGMRTRRLSPEDHDHLLAQVSHLPHAVAAALIHLPADAALDLCGKGFLDTTRIAGGDAALWRDIFLDNRDNLRRSLHSLQADLQRLLTCLESSDGPALAQWLAAASGRRDRLMEKKLREPAGE
jgi:prephenate dehydrogenase